MLLLAGAGRIQQATADVFDKSANVFVQLWGRLEAGDPKTWAAFVALSLVVLLAVGLWKGSIRVGGK